MALFVERHLWPSSSRGSPSPRVIKKASSSPSLLDSLLTVKTGRLSPGAGFGLAAAYRNSPSSPSHSPSSTSSAPPQFTSALIAQGTNSGRTTPQSPLTPVPIVRTQSAPAGGWGLDVDADEMHVDAEGFPCTAPAADEQAWRCPICDTTELPEPNRDSQMSCLKCGAGIEGDPRMVDGIRQSNCPLAEAQDQTADAPSSVTPEQARINALIEGDEDPQRRKARLLAAGGGTRIRSARGHHGVALQRGDRIVTASVQQEVRARIEGDSAEARKNRDVLKYLALQLKELNPSLHDNLLRHVKVEAVRIVSAFFVHEGVCGRGCGVTQTGAAAKMLAGCLLEAVLSKQCSELVSEGSAKHAPGWTREQFEKAIAQVRAPKESRNGGTMNRQQVLSSVGLFLRWSDEKICKPCPPAPAPAPPSLRQAADRQHSDYGCGRVIAPDPYDPMVKLRKSVNFVGTKMLHLHPDLRNRGLRAMWEPKTIEFLAASALPADLVALCLLKAIADGDEQASAQEMDYIHDLSETLCDQYQITTWTASEFTKQLAAVLPEPESTYSGSGFVARPPASQPAATSAEAGPSANTAFADNQFY